MFGGGFIVLSALWYELKDEVRLATAHGSYLHGGEVMFKRGHDLLSVSLDFGKLRDYDSNYDGGQ